jgi:4-diphosphocytidyl-2-C-methyl-D-erythritol kinase
LEVPAFAKINLTLEVLGRRGDGYHEVRTILQTIDLADRLEVLPFHALQVECDDASLNGEANLVWRAATALAERGKTEPQARIYIHKRIPAGMGLGGGSSDAAAALQALNQLWGLELSTGELAQVAAGVGSDVAFFLSGGTALAEGRGERITPLPPVPPLAATLICPMVSVPQKTARMYSRLTSRHYSDGGITRRMVEILAGGQFVVESIGGLLHNVFEEVVSQVFQEPVWLARQLAGSTGHPLHLCGAGPSLFCLPSNKEEYERVAALLQPYGGRVYLVHTVGPAVGKDDTCWGGAHISNMELD